LNQAGASPAAASPRSCCPAHAKELGERGIAYHMALAIGCNNQPDRSTAKERLELIGFGLQRRAIGIALGFRRLERLGKPRYLRDIRSFAPDGSRPEALCQAASGDVTRG